ncbi:hypothetical protein SDC9_143203 [bioreactor metagenome]|uniref:Uncharacterized protein n=1 Tax=bioreactor metagenome TaxID=1076179 RepID=A0A645E2W5_9ZZZZ
MDVPVAHPLLLVKTAVKSTPKRNTIMMLSLFTPKEAIRSEQPVASVMTSMVLAAFFVMAFTSRFA